MLLSPTPLYIISASLLIFIFSQYEAISISMSEMYSAMVPLLM